MTETSEPTRALQVQPVGCQVNNVTVSLPNEDTLWGPCGFRYGPEANQQTASCEQCLDEVRRLNNLLKDFTVDGIQHGIDLLTAGIDEEPEGDREEPHRHSTVFTPEQQIRYMVEVVAEAENRLEQAGLPVMALRRWLADSLDLRDLRMAHEHGHLEPQTIYEDDEDDA